MGLFDFVKPGPAYEITGMDFGTCRYGKQPEEYGTHMNANSGYLHARIRLTVNRPVSIHWFMKIMSPDAKFLQGKNLPAGYASEYRNSLTDRGEITLICPLIIEDFMKGGRWTCFIYDENDNLLFHNGLYVTSFEEEQESKGYMTLFSVEFAEQDEKRNLLKPYLPAVQTEFKSDMQYLSSRIKCTGFNNIKIRLDIEIIKPDGKKDRFSKEVSLELYKTDWLEITGWGNSKGTYYDAGTYIYNIYYKQHLLYSEKITVAPTLRDTEWIEIKKFTLVEDYFSTTSEDIVNQYDARQKGGTVKLYPSLSLVVHTLSHVKLYCSLYAEDDIVSNESDNKWTNEYVLNSDCILDTHAADGKIEYGLDITLGSFYYEDLLPMKGTYTAKVFVLRQNGKKALLATRKITI